MTGVYQDCKKNRFGGADGIRTHDLLDAIEARSQLRHGPTELTPKVYHTLCRACEMPPPNGFSGKLPVNCGIMELMAAQQSAHRLRRKATPAKVQSLLSLSAKNPAETRLLEMSDVSLRNTKFRIVAAPSAVLFAAILCFSAPLAAQQQGPLPPPPSGGTSAQPAKPAEPVAPAPARRDDSSEITHEPTPIPAEQIIAKFSAREDEFRRERDNYTYTQTFIIQTIDYDGQADGEYRMTSDITFNIKGKRDEHVTDAPPPTLQRIQLSQQDIDDLEHIQPFVLTTEGLALYNVTYVGRQQLDDLGTYVFDVAPKKIEKKQRYFQGRVWVEDKEFGIVKTDGKAVPDIKTRNGENVFPRFETFRENIESNLWFPTYTRSNDTLHFTSGDVRIHMTVRYANYKRFGSTIKIGAPIEVVKPKP